MPPDGAARMRRYGRTAIGRLAALWVLALIGTLLWAHSPRRVTAKGFSARDIDHALQQPARTPLSWRAGQRGVPLVPIQGQYFLRAGQLSLAGTALICGSLSQGRHSVSVEYTLWGVDLYGRLGRPLLPSMRAAGPSLIPAASCLDLCCGVQQVAAGGLRGLHVRRDEGVSVRGPDGDTELFPGRSYVPSPTYDEPRSLGIQLDGTRVVITADGQPVFDFHLAQPLTGAVALDTRDGAAIISRIEVH